MTGKIFLLIVSILGVGIIFWISWFWSLFIIPIIVLLGWDILSSYLRKKP